MSLLMTHKSSWLVALVVVAVVIMAARRAISLLLAWSRARQAGVRMRFVDILPMWLRKTDYRAVIAALIHCRKAGIDLPADFLEAHCLARGDVRVLAEALVVAKENRIEVEPSGLAAHILMGGDAAGVVRQMIADRRAGRNVSFLGACAADPAIARLRG